MLKTRKRALLLGEKGSKKRKQADVDGDDEELDFDDERAGGDNDEDDEDEEDPHENETAAEKRLRLAKQYIAQLKAAAGSDDDDEDGGFLSDRLKADAMEAAGRVQRRIAHRVSVPEVPPPGECSAYGTGRLMRGHRLSATAVALASDDATAFTGTKCGCVYQWDVETGKRIQWHRPGDPNAGASVTGTNPDWVKAKPRNGSAVAVYSVAVSSDSRYLAAGGGDKRVHIWDLRSAKYVQGFKGHKDLVSGVAFRRDTHELFSASYDRSVKLWSVDDGAYMDSLFGHQAEVTAVDVLRQERCVSAGADRTCRVWKIPEESQLVFRASGHATDCIKYVTGTEWVSGNYDGSVALWSQMRKKPVHLERGAHHDVARDAAPLGPGCPAEDAAGWVQSVAVCPGADLVASGAGDGLIRLWSVADGAAHKVLEARGALPARGFVNSLAIASSAKFLIAAVGQEPRLGRWLRDKAARNGTLVHKLNVADADNDADE